MSSYQLLHHKAECGRQKGAQKKVLFVCVQHSPTSTSHWQLWRWLSWWHFQCCWWTDFWGLPTGDCCVIIHHGLRAVWAFVILAMRQWSQQHSLHCETQLHQGRHTLAWEMTGSARKHNRRHSALDILLKVLQRRRSSALEILLLPQSHGSRQREPASPFHWMQDQEILHFAFRALKMTSAAMKACTIVKLFLCFFFVCFFY